MSEIVTASFATDLSEFSGTSSSAGGSIAWSSGAGLGGTSGGVAIGVTSGSTSRGHFAFTAFTGLTACRVFQYYDPNGVTMGSSEVHPIGRLCKTNEFDVGSMFVLHAKLVSGQRYIRCDSRADDGNTVTATDVAITDAEHWVEVHVTRASSAVAVDGTVTYYIDDSVTPVASHTGVDNYDQFVLVDRYIVGSTGGVDAGTTGTQYFDLVRINNDGSAIGVSSAPTVTDITAQTGTFGTQKSVACTIADTDSDIARCDVSTDGTALITLTASGSATLTNNGTTAPYVTGTHTDVVATLGLNIKLDAVRNGAELSHVETITVLVTDAATNTGNDTFTMTWSVPTGVGTQTLYLTGTQAQLNLALATVEVTPVTGFTGAIDCLMYSVTSTPLTDTDTFSITVQAQVDTIVGGAIIGQKDFTKYNSAIRSGRRAR